MTDGFFRISAASPQVALADPAANAGHILQLMQSAADAGADMLVLPELCVTGYTCGELFHSDTLLSAADKACRTIVGKSAAYPHMLIWAGMPVRCNAALYNCAVAICNGTITAAIPKTYLPDYNEFYEGRWFTPSPADGGTRALIAGQEVTVSTHTLVRHKGVLIAAEICEDLWVPLTPSMEAALAGAEVIVNMSASDDITGKYAYLRQLVGQQSARCICAYAYASAGFGESSTDLVFDAKLFVAENGHMLAANDRWQRGNQLVTADADICALRRDRMHMGTFGACARRNGSDGKYVTVDTPAAAGTASTNTALLRHIAPHPFVPSDDAILDDRCSEIIFIQTAALSRRLRATGCRCLTIGVSGGLDSTLALMVAVRAFDSLGLDRKGIVGVTMPGFGTTSRTHGNATTLMRALGVTAEEIDIRPAVNQHFRDIGHDPDNHDITYENSQARQRTLLLMDIANQRGGMVLGTGDLSELALGWATYNGDHMSMYGVNAGVPKTLVRYLTRWFAQNATGETERAALLDIIDTPVSPELLPANDDGTIAQKTEDLVGPYELHDFFLYYTLRYGFSPSRILLMACHAFAGRYDRETILHWERTFFRRFFAQQFKRSCLPDGPKVGSVCLSPRGDWRMPSDATAKAWLDQLDTL